MKEDWINKMKLDSINRNPILPINVIYRVVDLSTREYKTTFWILYITFIDMSLCNKGGRVGNGRF